MVLLQRIEDLRRAAVLIARVRREIDALLRRIAAKEGRIILPQPVRRGVSHGRLALPAGLRPHGLPGAPLPAWPRARKGPE